MELKNYKYIAKNKDGKIVKGKIEAINREVCKKFLKTKNYEVKQIKEYNSLFTKLNSITFGSLLKQKDLVFFLKQLGSLLNSGVNILSALELLALQKDSRNLRKLYFELYQEVYNGFSFSRALAKKPKEFPKLLVQMVEIGEMSGDLPKMILQMADYYDNQIKISRGIKGAVRMPIIYLGAAIAIAIGMLLFVFPNITGLFESFDDAELPGITQFFIDIGDFTANNALIVFSIVIIVSVILYCLNRFSKDAHYLFTVFGLKLPIIGKLMQMHNQIMIANALSQMLSNGINPLQSLKTIYSFLSNAVYKKIIEQTIHYVEDGLPFARAFSESSYIDPIMAKMISTGEQTSDIPNLMNNLAKYYNGVSDLRVEQLKNAIQPILLILVYSIVGVMILAIMLPMISLGGQI